MLSRLRRDIEKDKLRLQARQGYPITRDPYTPPILASAVGIKVFQGHNVNLKLNLGKDGCDLVKTKSLEFIRKYLMTYFTNYPDIVKGLKESPLPCNTIAVTFTMNNFGVDEGYAEFFQMDRILDLGDYTHQRLSENLQATYLNLDGTEYLAALCYYPVVHGMPKMMKLDRKLMNQAIRSVEFYPSKNRIAVDSYYEHNYYGRYCETAGKRVVVNFRDVKRGVCHQEIDYTKKDAYKFTRCEECAEEKKTYKYVRPEEVTAATPPAPKFEKPVSQKSAPKEQPPSDDTEMLSLIKSSKIGLPELKTLITDAQKNAVDAQDTSRDNSEQPKRKNTTTITIYLKSPASAALTEESAVTSESDLLEKQLPESVRLMRTMSIQTGVAEPTEGVEETKNVPLASPIPLLEAVSAQDLSHLESLVPDSGIPCEGPDEVCPFTPTKSLMETDPARALSLLDQSLKSVAAEEDIQSSTSAPMSDEDAQTISSASSTESLMDGFEEIKKEVTDVDSDIDAEIVN